MTAMNDADLNCGRRRKIRRNRIYVNKLAAKTKTCRMNQLIHQIAITIQRFGGLHDIRVVVVPVAILKILVAAWETARRQKSSGDV